MRTIVLPDLRAKTQAPIDPILLTIIALGLPFIPIIVIAYHTIRIIIGRPDRIKQSR